MQNSSPYVSSKLLLYTVNHLWYYPSNCGEQWPVNWQQYLYKQQYCTQQYKWQYCIAAAKFTTACKICNWLQNLQLLAKSATQLQNLFHQVIVLQLFTSYNILYDITLNFNCECNSSSTGTKETRKENYVIWLLLNIYRLICFQNLRPYIYTVTLRTAAYLWLTNFDNYFSKFFK